MEKIINLTLKKIYKQRKKIYIQFEDEDDALAIANAVAKLSYDPRVAIARDGVGTGIADNVICCDDEMLLLLLIPIAVLGLSADAGG